GDERLARRQGIAERQSLGRAGAAVAEGDGGGRVRARVRRGRPADGDTQGHLVLDRGRRAGRPGRRVGGAGRRRVGQHRVVGYAGSHQGGDREGGRGARRQGSDAVADRIPTVAQGEGGTGRLRLRDKRLPRRQGVAQVHRQGGVRTAV